MITTGVARGLFRTKARKRGSARSHVGTPVPFVDRPVYNAKTRQTAKPASKERKVLVGGGLFTKIPRHDMWGIGCPSRGVKVRQRSCTAEWLETDDV